MSDLTNKDAEQDTKIAVIDSTLENSIRRIEMVHQRIDGTNEELEKLRDRIRVLERWVAGAGAVIAAATPKPSNPYANKQIGKPIFPVLGIMNGGSSLIISFDLTKNKKITPIIAKPRIANK